jgi:hypothetical protein
MADDFESKVAAQRVRDVSNALTLLLHMIVVIGSGSELSREDVVEVEQLIENIRHPRLPKETT